MVQLRVNTGSDKQFRKRPALAGPHHWSHRADCPRRDAVLVLLLVSGPTRSSLD